MDTSTTTTTTTPTLMLIGGTATSQAAIANYASQRRLKPVFLSHQQSRPPESCYGLLILDRPDPLAAGRILDTGNATKAEPEGHAVHQELVSKASSVHHFNHWASAITHPLLIPDDLAYGLPSRLPVSASIHRIRRQVFDDAAELAKALEEPLEHAKRRFQLAIRLYQYQQVLDRLTSRQRVILGGVLRGESNKVMAMDLDVSKRLVEMERATLLRSFDTPNSVALARKVSEAETFASIIGPNMAELPEDCYQSDSLRSLELAS